MPLYCIARGQVAKVHEKIANARHDFLHKLSTKLVYENQVIHIEDLQMKIWFRIEN
jgi:putative transposase